MPGGEAHRVEIDLNRQVLFLYEGGSLTWILPVSSGTSGTPTLTGSFRIYSQRSGWETSRYGRLYNSQYFVGGYAIHGSLSVPNYPASHGCVRITMAAADILPGRLSIGTPVHVLGWRQPTTPASAPFGATRRSGRAPGPDTARRQRRAVRAPTRSPPRPGPRPTPITITITITIRPYVKWWMAHSTPWTALHPR